MTRDVVAGRVTIIVLNWNSGDLGREATSSARAQDWPAVEIVVVDNDSDDDSLTTILDAHPDVTVVRNPTNLGFGGGMNSGIAASTGEFVVPLNCDAELDSDFVRVAVTALESDLGLAAVGGLVDSPRVGPSGPLHITRTMRTVSLPTDHRIECDKVNGACPVFRMSALESVMDRFGGPYDATYFTYGEDVDLALSLRRLGWRYLYVPEAKARHVRSHGSSPRLADRRGLLRVTTLRNRHRNIVRHARPWWPPVTAFALVQDIGFAALRAFRGDWQATRDVLSAWRQAFSALGADRARRRVLRSLA